MDMEGTENEIIARLEEELRSEMIARLEQKVWEIEPDEFIWSDPGPVSLEWALGELGFEWSELEDIAKEHAHLGIPIREYPKTDLVYARAQELHAAVERKDEEALRDRLHHHLHSWARRAYGRGRTSYGLTSGTPPTPSAITSTRRSGVSSSSISSVRWPRRVSDS
jgi:hypothetical protein